MDVPLPEKYDPLILAVDDEPVITDTFVMILKAEGFRADGRYDGDQAVEYCKQYNPDLVFMGIVMPQMNGYDAALEIVKFHPACQFVFMSGCTSVCEEPDLPEKLGLPFPFLPKPTQVPEILSTLRAVLERRYQPMKVERPSDVPETLKGSWDVKCRFAIQ